MPSWHHVIASSYLSMFICTKLSPVFCYTVVVMCGVTDSSHVRVHEFMYVEICGDGEAGSSMYCMAFSFSVCSKPNLSRKSVTVHTAM